MLNKKKIKKLKNISFLKTFKFSVFCFKLKKNKKVEILKKKIFKYEYLKLKNLFNNSIYVKILSFIKNNKIIFFSFEIIKKLFFIDLFLLFSIKFCLYNNKIYLKKILTNNLYSFNYLKSKKLIYNILLIKLKSLVYRNNRT